MRPRSGRVTSDWRLPALLAVITFSAACSAPEASHTSDASASAVTSRNEDSARAAFSDAAVRSLLDTHLHELRGHLTIKIRNPNLDDESPLADQDVVHESAPGPHTYLGVLNADVSVLRSLLGDQVPMTIAGERVFLGEPAVAIDGHRHGDALYVAVKPFARPYGAYVRITCTFANCGAIWTSDILSYMRSIGFTGAPGVLEAHAEGLLEGLDVRAIRPGG